jgi:hypothetical protein
LKVALNTINPKSKIVITSLSESAAQRPRLKLKPRTVKEPVLQKPDSERNASIFGTGKPRDMPSKEDSVRSRNASEGSNN